MNATDSVSAALPAAPSRLRPRPPSSLKSSPPAAPAAPRPHRAAAHRVWPRRRASAQWGNMALMKAAGNGKLDCLEHLIAKGAKLNAPNNVRRGPAAGCGGRE